MDSRSVKKGVKNGDIHGNRLTSGQWFVEDHPPGYKKPVYISPEDMPVPSMKNIMHDLKLTMHNEIKKLKEESFTQEGDIGPTHHKTLALLMGNLTKLMSEENARLRALNLTKMSPELLQDLIVEFERRQGEGSEEAPKAKRLQRKGS